MLIDTLATGLLLTTAILALRLLGLLRELSAGSHIVACQGGRTK
jgi:hypothetical protein